jgi:signal transduction histidine kinase
MLFVAVSVAISLLVATRRRIERDREASLERERAARAEAERLSRHKDDFLAVVSHELRSPLTAILGWVTFIRRAVKDDEAIQRAIATIERNTRLQARLVDDLLDIARIVEGKLELHRERVDMAALARQVVESHRPGASRARIGLEFVEAPSAPDAACALVDVQRIEQAVGNLLSNAIKFTPPGGCVRVRLERAHDRVRVVVSDTGPGIDPDVLPYVFDKFRQGTGARAYGGLGLGLAIVKQLVALHGGTVRAVSEGKDRGSTFVIELPTLTASADRLIRASPP